MPWTYIFIFSPASREPFQVGLWCAYNIKYYLWRNSGMACTFLVLHPLFFTPIFLALFSSLQHPQIILSFLTFQKKKRIVIFCLAFYLTNLPHSAWCTSLKFFSYAHYWLLYWLSRSVSLIKLLLILPRIYLNFLSAHEYIQFYHFMWLAKGLQYHPLKHWCNGTGNKDLMLVTTLHFLPATVLWASCYCLQQILKPKTPSSFVSNTSAEKFIQMFHSK